MSSPAATPAHRPRHRWRSPARWTTFLLCILLTSNVLPWPIAPAITPAISPFIAISSILAIRSIALLSLIALPALILSLMRRRWFCHYACPLGLLQDLCQRRRGPAISAWVRIPRIGRWLAMITLGGACLGYPVFVWLDPLAIFSAFAGVWRWPIQTIAILSAAGLPIILLLSIACPHLWCMRICPLGALQEMLGVLPRFFRRSRHQPQLLPHAQGPARRTILGAGIGILSAWAIRKTRPPAKPVRPPGSIDESRFAGVCVRCGNCIRACPSHIITPDLRSADIAALLAPVLHFDDNYCREDCHRCTQQCPSGAIAPLSLPAKRKSVIGIARVELPLCRLADGQECNQCIQQCPYAAIIIQTTDDGFSTRPQINPQLCTGCGACECACPVRPTRAIRVSPC